MVYLLGYNLKFALPFLKVGCIQEKGRVDPTPVIGEDNKSSPFLLLDREHFISSILLPLLNLGNLRTKILLSGNVITKF